MYMAKIYDPELSLENDFGIPFLAQLGSARGGIRYIRAYAVPSEIPQALYDDILRIRQGTDEVWKNQTPDEREVWKLYAETFGVNPFLLFRKIDVSGSFGNRIGVGKIGLFRIG
jgi:hypothetical protein